MDFHEDKGPLLLSDWYHKDAFSIYYIETTQGPPQSQSVLINGMGVYSTADKQNTSSIYACNPGEANCSLQRAGMYSMFFEYGKKYKLRLINTSTATHFSFWIDGHDFTITSTDFVPIKPYKVNYVNVAIGECSSPSLSSSVVLRWLTLHNRSTLRHHHRSQILEVSEKGVPKLLDQNALL